MLYDLFISYSSVDKKVAEGVCGYMEGHGLRCFVAYRDIPLGASWAEIIPKAITQSRLLLVIFSNSFNISVQTDREIVIASKRQIPILNFRIEDCEMSGVKEYFLSSLNWIDAFPNPDEYFSDLLNWATSLINTKTEATTANKFRPENVIELYESAQQGNAIGQAQLALLYYNGYEGIPQSYEKAAYWYELSAKQGFEEAQISLGFCYLEGKGVAQNSLTAIYWFEKAANQGNPNAQYLLGLLYFDGQWVTKDLNKARYWLEIADSHGVEKARVFLKELQP